MIKRFKGYNRIDPQIGVGFGFSSKKFPSIYFKENSGRSFFSKAVRFNWYYKQREYTHFIIDELTDVHPKDVTEEMLSLISLKYSMKE
jgi:hypothetical protein